MITIDEFEDMLREIADALPDDLFCDLNGGILLLPEIMYHPKAQNEDLCIMGQYHYDSVYGRYISIYYGSFSKVFGHLGREALRAKVEHTVKHEFRHHLESKAGVRNLEVIDQIHIENYERRVKRAIDSKE